MVLTTYVKDIWQDFVSLVFPRICLGCRDNLVKHEQHLCTTCQIDLPLTGYHAMPENPIRQKLVRFESVDFAASYIYFHQGGLAQRLLHALKYDHNYEVGVFLGHLFAQHLAALKGFDFIVPVPIHRRKLAIRGYNQSTAIAEGLSGYLGMPLKENLVSRTQSTPTQTKKTKVDRWLNVAEVFEVVSENELTGKSVILVDDVITTGATTGTVCDCLEQAGVRRIAVLAIASGE